MQIHKTLFISMVSFISFMISSCNSSDEELFRIPSEGEICFTSSINAASRATATTFETNDAISIFAFKDASGFSSESYATNRKYIYSTDKFIANDKDNAIQYPEDDSSLAFQAIYPYSESVGPTFTFYVKEDQSAGNNYTLSDLMVASVGLTTNMTPNLKFAHRLSNVLINVTFDQTPAGEIKVDFSNVSLAAAVDMQKGTFMATGAQTGKVRAGSNGSNSYKAVIPPQTIARGAIWATIIAGEKSYTCKMTKTTEWKSGIQYVYDMHVNKEGIVTFTADIDPWGEPEEPEVPDTGRQLKRLVNVVSDGSNVETTQIDFTYDAQGRLSSYPYPAYADASPVYYPVKFTYADHLITTKLGPNDTQVLETVNYELNDEGNISKITVEYNGGKFDVGLTYTNGYLTQISNAAEKTSLDFVWDASVLSSIKINGITSNITSLTDTYKPSVNVAFWGMVDTMEFIFENSNYTACILSAVFLNRLGKTAGLLSKISGQDIIDFSYTKDADNYVSQMIAAFTINGVSGKTETTNFYY